MSAELIDTLAAIRDKRGDLNNEIVVEEASEPSHPLHHRFEWDDTVAGHKYRLQQAGELLRVTFRPDPKKPTELRAFVVVKGEETPKSSYVPVREVLEDPFQRKVLLQQMRREWETFKARYEHMAEFAELIAEIQPAV